MKELMKEFWLEEDGMGTLEIVIIILALVSVAIVFRDAITGFVGDLIEDIRVQLG